MIYVSGFELWINILLCVLVWNTSKNVYIKFTNVIHIDIYAVGEFGAVATDILSERLFVGAVSRRSRQRWLGRRICSIELYLSNRYVDHLMDSKKLKDG